MEVADRAFPACGYSCVTSTSRPQGPQLHVPMCELAGPPALLPQQGPHKESQLILPVSLAPRVWHCSSFPGLPFLKAY